MAWAVLLLVRSMTRFEVGATETVTVPVAALLPAFSAKVDGLTVTVTAFATSVFVTVRSAVPSVYPDPGAEAVIVTVLPESTIPLSTALM